MLPSILHGMDMPAMSKVLERHLLENFKALKAGKPVPRLDERAINEELAKLPDKPDERLR